MSGASSDPLSRRLSITVVVVSILVVAVAAILGGAAILGYRFYRTQERTSLERLAGFLADQAATTLSLPVWNLEDEQIRSAMRSVAEFPSVVSVVLYAPDGLEVKQIVSARGADSASVGFAAMREVSHAGELVGMVEVRLSPARLEQRLANVRGFLSALVLVLVVVTTTTLAVLLWRVVLRPVREIERLARDGGRRVSASAPARAMRFRGELETLRLATVEMLDLLEARYREIQEEARRNRLSERRFRILIDTIPDLIWLKDEDGTYLACNSMFERFFGAKEHEIVGKSDFDFVSAELAQFFREKDRKAIEAGSPSFNEEWIVFADDGHRALLETIKTPMFEEGGTLIGVLGIGRDITRRREAEEERHRLDERIAAMQKQEAQGALVAGVAVNVGGILRVIRGIAAQAEAEFVGDAGSKAMREVVAACRRGETVVQSLVRYSRPELAKKELFDLARLVRELGPDLLGMAGSRVEMEIEQGEGGLWVEGDADAMGRVLLEIVLNALEAMPDGGRLAVGLRGSDPDRVRVEISDTGRGIPPESIGRVLEPFHTTKGGGDGIGIGLGLSFAQGVVKAHGGELQIASVVGSGTRVIASLPRAAAPDSATAVPERRHESSGLRVLVIDDEKDMRDLTGRMLRKGGCTVLLAESGEKAMSILESGEVLDVVVLDHRMPGMGGGEALRAIRGIHPGMPVLVASGHPDIESLPEFHEPLVGFVTKPCGIVELMSKLHTLLDGASSS